MGWLFGKKKDSSGFKPGKSKAGRYSGAAWTTVDKKGKPKGDAPRDGWYNKKK